MEEKKKKFWLVPSKWDGEIALTIILMLLIYSFDSVIGCCHWLSIGILVLVYRYSTMLYKLG